MANDHDDYQSALLHSRSDPPNLRKAYELLSGASERGDCRAVYALATWYLFGNEVVEKDEIRGVSMLETLRNSFVAEAIFDLAVSYDHGKHVEQDDEKAFSLYMRAALLGDKQSCSQVSQFYAEGALVEHDEELANAWRKRSEQDERDVSPPYRLWMDD